VNGQAGEQWVTDFTVEKRNSAISLRKSQALVRATAFRRSAVQAFSTKYSEIAEKHKLSSEPIYNAEQGGLSTVHNPSKDSKQVGHVLSGETRVIGCINALSNSIPPVLTLTNHMLINAPPGTLDIGLQWLIKGGQIS
jgi:hypothetical protein